MSSTSQAAEISFTTTDHEAHVIRDIARRARALETKHGGSPRPIMQWCMDITATHANGNPLRLDELLAADDFNFMHDVFGIYRCLDRDTGKLTGFFRPRFSARQAEAA